MLVKRIITYFNGEITDEGLFKMTDDEVGEILGLVFEEYFHGTGTWSKIRMDKMFLKITRKRPRDLIKLCHLAARNAYKNRLRKIRSEEFAQIFSEYSQDRLQDTIQEYISELPEIDRLLKNMKPTDREKKDKMENSSSLPFQFCNE